MLYCKTFASIFIGSPMQNVDKAYDRPPLSRYVLQFVLLFQIFSISFKHLAAIISESATNHCTSYIPQGFTVATDEACVREQRSKATKYEFIHEFISVMLKLPNGICTDTSAFTDTNKIPSTHGSGGAVERFVHTFNWSTLHTDGGIRL